MECLFAGLLVGHYRSAARQAAQSYRDRLRARDQLEQSALEVLIAENVDIRAAIAAADSSAGAGTSDATSNAGVLDGAALPGVVPL